jgi:hypothetical protein
MNRRYLITGGVLTFLVAAAVSGTLPASITGEKTDRTPEWSLNMTAIEACSCPMFCQCYFNTEPAAHHHHHHDHGDAEHYCRFNMAWQVNHGHQGGTDLTGARFWMAGDLGSGWEDGRMDWSVLHFDPGVGPEQREGILEIVGSLFPVEWASFEIGEELPIEWRAEEDHAVATLDGGHAAEVRLVRVAQQMSDHPVVLENVQDGGAPRHDGFVLMPNEVEAYRLGANAFEYEGTNGFMITIDINSDDVATR